MFGRHPPLFACVNRENSTPDIAISPSRFGVRRALNYPARLIAENAGADASVAGLLVTTEAMVADRPEKKAGPAMPGGGGGMGDMDF